MLRGDCPALFSVKVKALFSLLCPQIAAHLRPLPFLPVFFCFQNEARQQSRPVILSQTDLREEGPVDQVPFTVGVLHVRLHLDFHGGVAHVSDPSDDDDDVTLKSTL